MNNKFLYIPSFQIGALTSNVKANNQLGDIDAKFWHKDFPEEFRYPYFLLTAGHSFKQPDTRVRMGLEDAFVVGDSGGFQIASGALKWDEKTKDENRKLIFNWLENNSDVAMNLDIPPRMNYEGKFDFALKESKENFQYFYENQSGKTKFLNVLQGGTAENFQTWYNEMKDFDFQGWSIGGAGNSIYKFLCGLSILMENKEHLKTKNEYVHILGASSVRFFIMFAAVQAMFNKEGINIKLMTDSSTPNIASKFGNYMCGYDIKNLRMVNFHMEKKPENKEYENYPLPVLCDYDKWLVKNSNLGDMVNFENKQYIGFVQHNLYMLLKMKEEIEYYVNAPSYVLGQIVSQQMSKIISIIKEIIESKSPLKTFFKYEYLIDKFDRDTNDEKYNVQEITKSNFFKNAGK